MSGEKGSLRRLLLPTLPASAGQSWAAVPRPWFPTPTPQPLLMASTQPSSATSFLIVPFSGCRPLYPSCPSPPPPLPFPKTKAATCPHHVGLLKGGSSKPPFLLSRVGKAWVRPGGRLRCGDRQGAADGDALLGEMRR